MKLVNVCPDLVLFRPFYSTVKDHTEPAFTVVKRNEQTHRPHEPCLGCCRKPAQILCRTCRQNKINSTNRYPAQITTNWHTLAHTGTDRQKRQSFLCRGLFLGLFQGGSSIASVLCRLKIILDENRGKWFQTPHYPRINCFCFFQVLFSFLLKRYTFV